MSRQKTFYVYILTNQHNNVLYTGVTNNLERRVSEHKQKLKAGFTTKYNINKLVYLSTLKSLNKLYQPSPAKSKSRAVRAKTK